MSLQLTLGLAYQSPGKAKQFEGTAEAARMFDVTSKVDGATRTLKRLQALVRRPPSGERSGRSGRVPADIATKDLQWLVLDLEEDGAYQEAQASVAADLRFEYLDQRAAGEALWRFVCRCVADRSTSHVDGWVKEHAREILDRVCYLPVEHLQVESEVEIAGLRLLPTASQELPREGHMFTLDPPVRCVVAVRVSGTYYARMVERARVVAEHGLRVLRVALRAGRGVHDDQLRFGLSEAYAFDNQATGWGRRPGAPIPLSIAAGDADLVGSQLVAALPPVPRNKLDRKADLAVRWIERAMLAAEPLVQLLYVFFALESILGDTGEGQKAGLVALRRAMLGHVTGGSFTHPSRTYQLYEEVRSAAVHGSEPPEVGEADVRLFASDVRAAVDEYLRYGNEQGFTRQSQLIRALDSHSERPQLIEWIRAYGGDMWDKYLDKIAPEPAAGDGVASA
jgi:hypothetical protein